MADSREVAEAGALHDFELTMAFQPILDVELGQPVAYEALVRGPNGEGAAAMLAQVTPETRYTFDQQCRVAAIECAVRAGIKETGARLSINFMPDVITEPTEDSQRTLRAARDTGFPPERLVFEFSEHDRLDAVHIASVIEAYHRLGFTTAFDDFGSGHAGLGHLSRFTPDFLKLDPQLVRGLCSSWSRRLVVENVIGLAHGLGIKVIAEGVETRDEYDKLRRLGVRYMQGYYIAQPAHGALPRIAMSDFTGRAAA
ncbi:MAG: EAL domain-containing protein [Pseudomonadota bacterium]